MGKETIQFDERGSKRLQLLSERIGSPSSLVTVARALTLYEDLCRLVLEKDASLIALFPDRTQTTIDFKKYLSSEFPQGGEQREVPTSLEDRSPPPPPLREERGQ